MCGSCVAEAVRDGGGIWPVMSQRILVTAWLTRELYEQPGCSSGGPLHVVADDFNVETEFVENALGRVDQYRYSRDPLDEHYDDEGNYLGPDLQTPLDSKTARIARQLCGELLALSEAERAVALAIAHHYVSPDTYEAELAGNVLGSGETS